MSKKFKVVLLRIIHALFAVYFITCIFYVYYVAITLDITIIFAIAISSLLVEGLLVFVLNGGNCPLIYLQNKLNDPIPFFNLFLPDYLAKKAVPFFSGITILGILLIIVRLILKV